MRKITNKINKIESLWRGRFCVVCGKILCVLHGHLSNGKCVEIRVETVRKYKIKNIFGYSFNECGLIGDSLEFLIRLRISSFYQTF